MSVQILRGDARKLPLPDASVDLLVTSPPYWALRSYTDTCAICRAAIADGIDPRTQFVNPTYDEHVRRHHHYEGQIGAEPTPAEYIDNLIDCTREWMRVLKPSGSMWINLGDKYSQRVALRQSSHQDGLFPDRPDLTKDWKASKARGETRMPKDNVTNAATGAYVPEKSLIGLPWRYALRCIDELGLILRAEVIWSKPNGLPESVTDRVRRSHETWFHMVKSPRYFAAVDTIREAYDVGNGGRQRAAQRGSFDYADRNHDYGAAVAARAATGQTQKQDGLHSTGYNPLGKLPGSVWTVATQPLKVPVELGVDHFAAFSMEFPRRIIQGWSPSGVCTACGEGRRPVSNASRIATQATNAAVPDGLEMAANWAAGRNGRSRTERVITGEACACPDTTAPTRPAVVLDPFGGTGTVALVADVLGRDGISVDMSADYCRLARWRTTDPGQRAAALEVEKPALQLDGQQSLLDLFSVS